MVCSKMGNHSKKWNKNGIKMKRKNGWKRRDNEKCEEWSPLLLKGLEE